MRYLLLPLALLCFSPAEAQSPTDLYDLEKLTEIRITFPDDNWRYHLDSLRYNGEEMHLGAVRVNGKSFEQAGVRYQAVDGWEPGRARNSLHIELDLINQRSNYDGYTTINLSSALRDPSLVREILAYEIARDYMAAPLANYAKVYVNDELYGLFVNIEHLAKPFLERNFERTDGTFLIADPDKGEKASPECYNGIYASLQKDKTTKCYFGNFDLRSERGWDDLIELITVLNERPQEIEKVLDVDRALWMLAFDNLMVNLDSYIGRYSDNYYLYKQSDGRFAVGIWEKNFGFGSYKNTGQGSDLRISELRQMDPLLHADNDRKPLVKVLLSDPVYRRTYLAHMRTILHEHFRGDAFAERARELQEFIREHFVEDPNAHYSQAEFDKSLSETIGQISRVPGIVNFMEERTEYIKRLPQFTVVPPKTEEVTVVGREKFARGKVEDFKVQAKVIFNPKQVHVHYRFDPNEPYQKLEMFDNGESNDRDVEDGWYGARIVPPEGKDTVEYYIVSQNAQSLSYIPTAYTTSPFKTTLAELNN